MPHVLLQTNHQEFETVSKRKKLYEENNIPFKICGKVWGMRCGEYARKYMTSWKTYYRKISNMYKVEAIM